MEAITDDENKEALGKRGEALFIAAITKFVELKGRIFQPTFMGDKFPAVDCFVELNGYSEKKAFFFASVKITTLGFYDVGKTRIHVVIPRDKVEEMKKFQVPTYLFGIDEQTETIYFLNANSLPAENLNGIPVQYPLNPDNVLTLWDEVAVFYDNTKEITNFTSQFK